MGVALEGDELEGGMGPDSAQDRPQPCRRIRRRLLLHVCVSQPQEDTHPLGVGEVKQGHQVFELRGGGLGPPQPQHRLEIAGGEAFAAGNVFRVSGAQLVGDRVHAHPAHRVELEPYLGGNRAADDRIELIEILDDLTR